MLLARRYDRHKAMTSKQQLRQKAKAQRASMSAKIVADLSQKICDRLSDFDLFERCRRVFIYVSFGNEVSTHDFIRLLLGSDRIVTVPKMVDDQQMVPVRISAWEELVRSDRGILSTADRHGCQEPLDVCVAPGIAFSERGHRLGYGAGCYDRFLSEHPELFTIGLAFEQQIYPKVPNESYDRAVDAIVTERRVLLTGRTNR